jgi:prolyl-tRNA editing enzyme YbaK/EbsC (Cys-tRNA(Pro) deacylase)
MAIEGLDSRALQTFMDQNHIPGEIVHCAAPTPTVDAAAQVMGVAPEQIVKTLIFLVAGQPVAVITCGMSPVDRRPIAERFGVGRKQVKMASSAEVLAIAGYPAGAVPPFGHCTAHVTLIDPRVLAQPFIFAGGGEEDALVHLSPADILRVTGAEVRSLTDPT